MNKSPIECLLTPRESRALRALLRGPMRREQIDRVGGVSNGPDLIKNLRAGLGLEIPCERIPSIDRDGKRVKVGVYSLSPADRQRVCGIVPEAS